MILTAIIGVISTITFLTLIMVISVYTDAIQMPAKVVLISIACVIFVVGMYFAMHMATTRYLKCHIVTKRAGAKKFLQRNRI